MEIETLAKALKALSNANRLKIYLEIAAERKRRFSAQCDLSGCPVSRIMEKLNIGAPTVSHHLKELVNAGLIFTERQGKFVVARVNEKMVTEVTRALNMASLG